MIRFEYDSTRKDPAFQVVMQEAQRALDSCGTTNCLRCPYHRLGNTVLVVCYTEKLADALILKGVIDREAAEAAIRRQRAGKRE